VIGFLAVSPFVLLVFELFTRTDKPFQNVGLSLLGIFYLVLPFIFAMPQLSSSRVYSFQGYGNYFTPNIVAGLLFLTWANDSFAYLIGSRIGKRKLFERISPKKTWEGTIGGGLACMLTSLGVHHYLGVLSLWDWLAVALIVAIFGTIGDLVESMLKRSLGVKDSGHIMPGHGGFLDRFDAFIFAMPFVYLFLIFFHVSV
jgi:phosphatidate cytidylyltransferase